MTATMTQSPEPRTLSNRSLSPHKGANGVSSSERFPSFDDTAAPSQFVSAPVAESPQEFTPGQFFNQDIKWPARKINQGLRDARHPGVFTHRSRKSVSDAINKFRTRQGSVSENAQELAEALKAPISYKLIVSSLRAGWNNADIHRRSASPGT